MKKASSLASQCSYKTSMDIMNSATTLSKESLHLYISIIYRKKTTALLDTSS